MSDGAGRQGRGGQGGWGTFGRGIINYAKKRKHNYKDKKLKFWPHGSG